MVEALVVVESKVLQWRRLPIITEIQCSVLANYFKLPLINSKIYKIDHASQSLLLASAHFGDALLNIHQIQNNKRII